MLCPVGSSPTTLTMKEYKVLWYSDPGTMQQSINNHVRLGFIVNSFAPGRYGLYALMEREVDSNGTK